MFSKATLLIFSSCFAVAQFLIVQFASASDICKSTQDPFHCAGTYQPYDEIFRISPMDTVISARDPADPSRVMSMDLGTTYIVNDGPCLRFSKLMHENPKHIAKAFCGYRLNSHTDGSAHSYLYISVNGRPFPQNPSADRLDWLDQSSNWEPVQREMAERETASCNRVVQFVSDYEARRSAACH